MPISISTIGFLTFFLKIPAWSLKPIQETEFRLKPPTNDNELELMTAISNLANTVIANTASRSLAK
jgi:rapamycin-insensitive companion of mTOR